MAEIVVAGLGHDYAILLNASAGTVFEPATPSPLDGMHPNVGPEERNLSRPLIAPHTSITNAYNKETFVFTDPVERADLARFDVILAEGGTGGGNAVPHIHPNADETFFVHSGRVKVVINGTEHFGAAGETLVVPRGQPHFFANAHAGETRLTVSFSPGQKHLRFFLNLAAMTAVSPRCFSPQGDARLLSMALALHAYAGHLYLADRPVPVQRALFAVLAPIARLLGHRMLVPPEGEVRISPEAIGHSPVLGHEPAQPAWASS
jgi:quercetin dioxygenase-like cupin family protein